MCVGLLHAFYLGILNTRCRVAIWTLIDEGAYGYIGTEHELTHIAAIAMRASLMKFYANYQRKYPLSNLTRVSDFTQSMLGTWNKPALKTKAAETWGVALFLIEEIKARGAALSEMDRTRLRQAGEQLVIIVQIWKSSNWCIERAIAQKILDHYKIHMNLMRPYDCFTSKHHIMIHPLSLIHI